MRHDIVPGRMPPMSVPRETRHAVRSEQTQALGEIVPVGDDEAAFTHRHVLVTEKGEAADVPDRASLSAMRRASARIEVTSADRMARVFDERQTMARAELSELGQPSRIAGIVHDHDAPGPRREQPLDGLRIDRRLVEAED